MKKKLLFIVAIVTLVFALTLVPNATASTTYEKEFIALINELRINNSVDILSENPSLSDQARAWAEHLAEVGTISHDPNLAASRDDYEYLGENVGKGSTVASIFAGLVNSPGHYRNMVNPDFNEIGVGVATAGSTIFTVHRFMDPYTGAVTTITVTIPEPVVPTTAPSSTTIPVPVGKIASSVYPKTLDWLAEAELAFQYTGF